MKVTRVAVIAVSALAFLAGVFFGLSPIRTTLTQISPDLRLLNVTCGNGYLGITPPARPDALVELPGEPGVFLPKASYDTHCSEAVGWRRYASWALTAVGALGMAITFAGARTTPLPSPAAGGGSSAAGRGRGGAHRARSGDEAKSSEAKSAAAKSAAAESAAAESSAEPSPASSPDEPSAEPSGSSAGNESSNPGR